MPKVEAANKLDRASYIKLYLPECQAHGTISTTSQHGSSEWQIDMETAQTISPSDAQACFALIEATSKPDYMSSSTGWHPKKKQREMRLPDLRYLLVRRGEALSEIQQQRHAASPIEGFVSFMMTYEDGFEVVYIYEIHITSALRGHGLGGKLMGLVERAGARAGMVKAMLTVFTSNEAAQAFYFARGYVLDEYSPVPRKLRGGTVKEPDYKILSKSL